MIMNSYQEIVASLTTQKAKKVLITGPHRSGTTFAAKILARELSYPYFTEENIHGGSRHLLKKLDESCGMYVLQAPGFSERAHDFPFDAVVFIRRNEADVLESMDEYLSDKLVAGQTKRTLKLLNKENSDLSLPALKLKAFEEVQMPVLGDRGFILDYESLADHDLWVPESEREGWHIRQVTPMQESDPPEELSTEEFNDNMRSC